MDIPREKIADLIKKGANLCRDSDCSECGYAYIDLSCRFYLIADHLIANGVTVQEWIPVTERLPEDDERLEFYDDGRLRGTTVLAYTEYGRTVPKNRLIIRPTGDEYFDQFVTDGWEWSKGTENVTHWMPMPKPPKEGGAKENENQVI